MTDKDYLKALGARVLSEANDLKRTPEALASDLGYDIETVRSVISGNAPVKTTRQLLEDMTKHYPVSFSDLWIEPDDTNHGVLIVRAAESDRSSRVFDRKDRNGKEKPYYDYRDTAMSRTAPFKPEWIQPLRHVSDADPNNADVAFNKGHLMHQMTFFIGEVNFYWELDGQRYCAEMNTCDSNYITPFVPHSFTSRDPENLGLIIAVTYAGRVRMALDEFSRMDVETVGELAGDLREPLSAFRAVLKRQLATESLTHDQLAKLLTDAGLETSRAEKVSHGEEIPNGDETDCLAKILNVVPSDLTVAPLTKQQEVVLCHANHAEARLFPESNQPAYRLNQLARTAHQPQLKGFEVTVLDDLPLNESAMRHGLHEYVYNYGTVPVTIKWDSDRIETLGPGDSVYVRPMVSHAFGRIADADEGHLFIVRVPGRLGEEEITEFSAFASAARARVTGETTKWF
jgi:hypothetical protein